MSAIELMLEALKARIPCINDYTTMREYIDAADMHNAAIAAGEAELKRAPDVFVTRLRGDLLRLNGSADLKFGDKLYRRGEIK